MRLGDGIGQLLSGRFFFETWRQLDAERSTRTDGRFDPSAAIALSVATLALVMMEYWGSARGMDAQLAWLDGLRDSETTIRRELTDGGFWDLAKLGHWALSRVLGFAAVPMLALAVQRRRVRDQHLSRERLGEHLWIYQLAFGVVFVCVVAVSFTDEFATYYPFYDLANRSWLDFVLWEAMYIAQFFALEFFFRGYLLEQCRASLGSGAIFASCVPYVMIHFGKPMPETVGALLAGIFLGTLAMKTRSIWLGFAIHVSVALSMDVAALLQTRGLPTEWLPPGIGS